MSMHREQNALYDIATRQHDDFETYREVYPLFDPLYVPCDRDKTAYEPLADVARQLLPPLHHRLN